jgi:hypothetical protein
MPYTAGSRWSVARWTSWIRRAMKNGVIATNLDLQPEGACSRIQVAQRHLGIGLIGRIEEDGHARRVRHQLAQKRQPLRRQLDDEKVDAGQVAARPCEARHQPVPDRVVPDIEDDGSRRGRCLGRERRGHAPGCDNHGNAAANKVGRQRRQALKLIVGPAVFDRQVFALDIAGILEALTESAHRLHVSLGRLRMQEADDRHCWLLRPRRKWPRGCRTAECCDELPTPHGLCPQAEDHTLPHHSKKPCCASQQYFTADRQLWVNRATSGTGSDFRVSPKSDQIAALSK